MILFFYFPYKLQIIVFLVVLFDVLVNYNFKVSFVL